MDLKHEIRSVERDSCPVAGTLEFYFRFRFLLSDRSRHFILYRRAKVCPNRLNLESYEQRDLGRNKLSVKEEVVSRVFRFVKFRIPRFL